jgi:AP endonuclease-2
VVLEFPAFVLIGVYCPATRDESRDEFRLGFLTALDARVRNLVRLGKRVLLTGDLNIIREELDTANAEEQLKKRGITVEEYISTPARRMFNQLLMGGKVFGNKDEGRETQVMWDLCRLFHPTRQGMFTCWEQKINARPGNFGSRIDYVLCSYSWNDWFSESDIQEGLMGSDHCPVYAVLKETVEIDGTEVDIRDLMSANLFEGGVRQREWSVKDLLPISAKLIPEFNGRRTIRDMFTKRPSLTTRESSTMSESTVKDQPLEVTSPSQQKGMLPPMKTPIIPPSITFAHEPVSAESTITSTKRQNEASSPGTTKRSKPSTFSKSTSASAKGQAGKEKGQSSLMGFFKPKAPLPIAQEIESQSTPNVESKDSNNNSRRTPPPPLSITESTSPYKERTLSTSESPSRPINPTEQDKIVDPIVSKESWSKLLGKRVAPRCSDHNEPCISMKTKKRGENCGRSFYMCSRPLGPSGQKEKKTQWRCGTFIWSSDWTTGNAST